MTVADEVNAVVVGPVGLQVPSDPNMSRVIRLAASGLASLAGCSIEQIEDIKIAVSEVLIALVELGHSDVVDLTMQVSVLDGAADFLIRGEGSVGDLRRDHPDLLLSESVLDVVCSFSEIDIADGRAQISAVIAGSGPPADGT